MPSLRLPAALRQRIPSLPAAFPKPAALPLPRTLATAALLILVPALILPRWSRPRAAGLEQLMGAASLIQSFPATPERPVPALWSERLGALPATRFWRGQRRVWWQLWANHAETSPFLVLEVSRDAAPAATLPPTALRVGDLLVVGEDATARRQLAESLRPLQRRSRAGLPRLCLARLQAGQAVYWNAAALGEILGPLAPLLERFQVGCLSLALEGNALRWQGEAAPSDGRLALSGHALGSSPEASTAGVAPAVVPELPALVPLPDDTLLELEGASLEPLLRGLLERPIIRDPLAGRYGLEGPRLQQALRSPFRLRLRPLASGPFQASLELQLVLESGPSSWTPVLDQISAALKAQGLQNGPSKPGGGASGSPASPPASLPAAPPSSASLLSGGATTLWRRADGVPVGGWSWIPDPGRPPQLLFVLGPLPSSALPMPVKGPLRPGPDQLWLRLRPGALANLALLPPEMPQLLQRSSQVWMEAEPLPATPAGEPISRLKGRLQVSR